MYKSAISTPYRTVAVPGANTVSVAVPNNGSSAVVGVAGMDRANAVELKAVGFSAIGQIPQLMVNFGGATAVAHNMFEIVDGDWTEATLKLVSSGALTPFLGYTFAANDKILVRSGTDVNPGVYTIVAKDDDDTIELASNITDDLGDLTNADIVAQILPLGIPLNMMAMPLRFKIKTGTTHIAVSQITALTGVALIVTPLIINDA